MFIVLLLGVYTGIYLLALDIAYVEVVFFSQPIIQSEKRRLCLGESAPDPDSTWSRICFDEKASRQVCLLLLAGQRIKRNATHLFILQTYKYPCFTVYPSMLVSSIPVCLFHPKKVSRTYFGGVFRRLKTAARLFLKIRPICKSIPISGLLSACPHPGLRLDAHVLMLLWRV